MRIVVFHCQECGHEQDKWLPKLDAENTEPCDKCEADASKLKRGLSSPKHSGHISWSKWRVGHAD